MSVQRSNLNVGSGFEWRLINAVKESQSPFNNAGTATGYLQTVSLTGYPTEFTNGVSFGCQVRPDPAGGVSTYVIKWLGQAAVSTSNFGTLTGSSRSRNGITWNSASPGVSTLNGRMTFQCGPSLNGNPVGSHFSAVTVKGNGSAGATNQLTNLVVCRADEEDYFDDQIAAGVPDWRLFRPGYIAALQSYNPRCLRFMDDIATNTNMRSRWADGVSLSAMSMNIKPYVNIVSSGGVLGQINNTSDVFTCDAYSGMPVGYVHGEIVQGHVSASNTTTSPTLNVGGRGAKSILNGTASGPTAPVISGTNSQVALIAGVTGSGNGSYTFFYDQYFDAWIFTPNGAILGRPIEHMVALCNASGIPGWFNIPAYATDDYVTQFANYLVANYTPNMVQIEYDNEIWNTGLGFSMTLRMNQWGLSTFTSPQITTGSNAAISAWYGFRLRQIAQIMQPIFAAAGQSSKLKITLAMQGSDGDIASSLATTDENLRLQNTAYAALSGANAPVNFVDYFAYAWYHRPTTALGDAADVGWSGVTQAATLKTHVDAYIANPATYTAGFDFLQSAWLADAAVTSRMLAAGRYDNFNALAAKYNKQVTMYEMNSQVDAPSAAFCAANAPWSDSAYGGQTGKINAFLLAFFASPQYQSVISSLLLSFFGYSRSLSASIFSIASGSPWLTFPRLQPTIGTVGGDLTQSPYGNWKAHVAWNNKPTRTFTLKN